MRALGARRVIPLIMIALVWAAFGVMTVLAAQDAGKDTGGPPPPPKIEVDPNGEGMFKQKKFKQLRWWINGKEAKPDKTCVEISLKDHKVNKDLIGDTSEFKAFNGTDWIDIVELSIKLKDSMGEAHELILARDGSSVMGWECRKLKVKGKQTKPDRVPQEGFDEFVSWEARKAVDGSWFPPVKVYYQKSK